MSSLHFTRHAAQGEAREHPLRFALGLILAGTGAALWLGGIVRFLVGTL